MVIRKARITRFVSGAVAAACLAAGLNVAPFTMEIEAADQLTAFEITEDMQIGWNLGNTLDAYMSDANQQPLESYGLDAETCWGNPRTTQAMIDAVKAGAAGIDMQGYSFHLPSKSGFYGEDK